MRVSSETLSRGRRAADALLRRLLFGSGAGVTYSQEGEDRLLLRLLEGTGPGFYVDVGAHHPSRFSNTRLLYSLAWHGLNIEPRPGTQKRFRSRSRDTTLEVGVSAIAGSMTYYVMSDDALNTFPRERAEFLTATTPYRLVRTISVPVLPLATILDRHLESGQPIDLLNVDVEGLDLEVLRSNDWTRYRPTWVIAEDIAAKSIDDLGSSPISSFMREKGYEPVAKTYNSVFFRQVAPNSDT